MDASTPDLAVSLEDLIQRHAAAAAELTTCSTFREMAAAIARHMIGEGQFVAMNTFVYDADGNFIGFRTLASANRRESYEASFMVDITLDEVGYPVRHVVEDGLTVHMAAGDDDTRIHPKLLAWTSTSVLPSSLMLPMRSQGKAFGIVTINNVREVFRPTPEQIHLFQSLADQVGALVLLNRLTAESLSSREVSERQALAFNELVSGQSIDEMALIIARHMLPRPGTLLSITEMGYDERGRIARWHVLNSVNRTRAFDWQAVFELQEADMSCPMYNTVADGQPFIVPDTRTATIEDLGPTLYNWAKDSRIGMFLIIPIVMDARTIATIVISSRESYDFSAEEINAFLNIADQMAALVHVRLLLDQTEVVRAIVDNLVLANRLVTTTDDPGLMARAVMYTMGKGFTGAGLVLFDGPVRMGQMPAASKLVAFSDGASALNFQTQTYHFPVPDAGILSRMNDGQPHVMEGPHVHDLLPRPAHAFLMQGRMTWLAAFGLRSGGSLMGMLLLVHTEHHTLQPQEIDAYTTLADQIAIALENQRLLRDAHRQAEQLRQINTFSQAIQASFDMRELLSIALTNAWGIFEMDHLSVLLFDPASRSLCVAGWYDGLHMFAEVPGEPLETIESTSGGLAWVTQNLVQLNDLAQEEGLRHTTQPDMRATLSAPLFSHGSIAGVLEAGTRRPRPFGPADPAIIEQLAGQLSISIENAEAYTQNQNVAKSRTLVNEISAQLQQQTEIDRILSITMNELGRALGAKRARIRMDMRPAASQPDKRE